MVGFAVFHRPVSPPSSTSIMAFPYPWVPPSRCSSTSTGPLWWRLIVSPAWLTTDNEGRTGTGTGAGTGGSRTGGSKPGVGGSLCRRALWLVVTALWLTAVMFSVALVVVLVLFWLGALPVLQLLSAM